MKELFSKTAKGGRFLTFDKFVVKFIKSMNVIGVTK